MFQCFSMTSLSLLSLSRSLFDWVLTERETVAASGTFNIAGLFWTHKYWMISLKSDTQLTTQENNLRLFKKAAAKWN